MHLHDMIPMIPMDLHPMGIDCGVLPTSTCSFSAISFPFGPKHSPFSSPTPPLSIGILTLSSVYHCTFTSSTPKLKSQLSSIGFLTFPLRFSAFCGPSLFVLTPPYTHSLLNMLALLARGSPAVHTQEAKHTWLNTIADMRSHSSCQSADRQLELTRIADWIEHGITLDLSQQPAAVTHENTQLVIQHADLVRTRLLEYIDLGAVIQLPASSSSPPSMIQPLHVIVKAGKKPRLVIDLSRNLNEFVDAPHFHLETVRMAVQRSKPHCWYSKLDLSNCFLSFPLHPSMFKYFTFCFEGCYYCFTRLPFGFNKAPYICTQLLSVVSFRLKVTHSIVHTRYLDDWLLSASTQSACASAQAATKQVFRDFGLVNNVDKEVHPTQVIEFLGIIIDSVQQQIRLSAERVSELLQLLQSFTVMSLATIIVKRVRTLLGKLSFAATVLPTARPFMRELINMTINRSTRQRARFTSQTKAALQFWYQRLPHWNGLLVWPSVTSIRTLHIYTDASIEGFGFHCSFHTETTNSAQALLHAYYGVWDSRFSTHGFLDHRRIALLELFTVLIALHQFNCLFTIGPFRAVRLHTDNNTNVGAINAQSTRSAYVGPILRAIYDFCFRHSLSISAIHIEGSSNVLADFLSRPSLHLSSPTASWSAHAASSLTSSSASASASSAALVMNTCSFLCSDCLSVPELFFDRQPPNPLIPLSTWLPTSPSV
jgi:hypothetical protein